MRFNLNISVDYDEATFQGMTNDEIKACLRRKLETEIQKGLLSPADIDHIVVDGYSTDVS